MPSGSCVNYMTQAVSLPGQIPEYSTCRFYLPPIILFAGLSVRKKAFFKQLPTIASLGIAGTYIAFALIAALMFAVSKFIHGITLAVRSPSCLECSHTALAPGFDHD